MPTHGEPGEGGRTMSGRIAEESSAEKCSVWGCERLSQTIAGEGLGVRLCRSHANAFQRHGSVDRRSFTATEIRPLRRIALEWIKANESDPLVAETIVKVRALYIPTEASGAGPRPGDPARAAWELRHISGLDPRKVMAARLAVEIGKFPGIQTCSDLEGHPSNGHAHPSSLGSTRWLGRNECLSAQPGRGPQIYGTRGRRRMFKPARTPAALHGSGPGVAVRGRGLGPALPRNGFGIGLAGLPFGECPWRA
jgi:hypothetical protein